MVHMVNCFLKYAEVRYFSCCVKISKAFCSHLLSIQLSYCARC